MATTSPLFAMRGAAVALSTPVQAARRGRGRDSSSESSSAAFATHSVRSRAVLARGRGRAFATAAASTSTSSSLTAAAVKTTAVASVTSHHRHNSIYEGSTTTVVTLRRRRQGCGAGLAVAISGVGGGPRRGGIVARMAGGHGVVGLGNGRRASALRMTLTTPRRSSSPPPAALNSNRPDSASKVDDPEDGGETSPSAILKRAMAMAAEDDTLDADIDDDELAALEALDKINGWEGGDDEEGMAVAKGVAASMAAADGVEQEDEFYGDEEEGSSALYLEGDEEEEDGEGDDDDDDDDEGVALLRELFEYGGAEVTEWVNLGEDEDVEVSGIANDSRVVLGGDVFVCVRGSQADGHDYALDAIAAGAVAVVCMEPIPGLSDDTPQVIVPDTSAALPRIAAAFYGNPSTALTTVGVTGTNGKTTTTYIVRSILEAADMPCGVIGTTGYELEDVRLTPHGGVWEAEERDPTEGRLSTNPGWLAPYKGKYEVPNTTPDALQCQQLLAGMLDNGASAAAMEVSSHALAQGRVDCTDFDVAVFTNLSHDHLDFHGSMANYREAKALLFRGLTDPERQRAVINLDAARDPDDGKVDEEEQEYAREARGENNKKQKEGGVANEYGEEGAEDEDEEEFDNASYFIEAAGGGDRVPIITYATHRDKADVADVFVEKVELTLFETLVTIRTPVGSFDAVCGLVGKVNVSNIAAAVAVGVALEIPLDVIAAGLESVDVVPGRMEMVDEGQPFAVIVDYAHTPDALRRAIQSVRQTGAEKIITVFGCGGDRDPTKRSEMGRVADKYSDVVFVTNDNPRTEDPYKILDDVVSGFRDRVYEDENIKEEAMFPFLKDMYLIHPNARHETMKLQNMCRRYVIVDRYYAIRGAIAMAGDEDAVLICGKGHEDYIVVGHKKHWFDDRVEARDALQKIVRVQEAGIDTFNIPWGRAGAAAAGTGNVLDA